MLMIGVDAGGAGLGEDVAYGEASGESDTRTLKLVEQSGISGDNSGSKKS